jgi:hypothetical protein
MCRLRVSLKGVPRPGGAKKLFDARGLLVVLTLIENSSGGRAMETLPEFGFKELFTHLVADMAKAVCERAGEGRERQVARSQAAAHTVIGLKPRDMIEAMLAGHCMMFHELMVDSVRDALRGEPAAARRAARASILNMNKSFDNCLSRLEYYQTRPSHGHQDVHV